MDGGEGGYVDEIILCVWGGGVSKRKPKKNKIFHEEILFFSG